MSEKNLEQNSKQSQDSSAAAEKKESQRKSLFGNLNLNQDLKKALNSWDDLSEQVVNSEQIQNKVSPNEERLHEVKKLLGELKNKLSEFE